MWLNLDFILPASGNEAREPVSIHVSQDWRGAPGQCLCLGALFPLFTLLGLGFSQLAESLSSSKTSSFVFSFTPFKHGLAYYT